VFAGFIINVYDVVDSDFFKEGYPVSEIRHSNDLKNPPRGVQFYFS